MTNYPIQGRDKRWLDTVVTVVVGPFDMPTTAALRDAVSELARRNPTSRLTWRADVANGHWTADRSPESIVVERHWDDDAGVSANVDRLANDESLDLPLTLARYPHHLGLRMSHGIGDGRQCLLPIAAALHSAVAGRPVPWPVVAGGRWPLLEAGLRTFGRRPSLVRKALRNKPRLDGDPAAAEAPARPWAPSPRSYQTTLTPQATAETVKWAQRFAPHASRASLRITLVLRAFAEVGMKVSPDVGLLVDLRRYLGWRFIDGNFTAGVRTRLDAQMTPDQVSHEIRTMYGSARPLASHVLTSILPGETTPTPTAVPVDGVPRLSFSDLGKSPEITGLPFLPDAPEVYAGSVTPEGPLGVAVLSGETARSMSYGFTFHDNVVDAELVARAVTLIETEPLRLLSDGWSLRMPH